MLCQFHTASARISRTRELAHIPKGLRKRSSWIIVPREGTFFGCRLEEPADIDSMKVVGRELLEVFCRKHSDVRAQVNAWVAEAEEAEWKMPNDIKARYAHASFLADNEVIFNLKGNRYRLDVKVSYKNQTVFIKRIGTHEEYNSWKF